MKKIFTLFAAVVCGLALNAKTIYLNPGEWATDNAVFFAHSWSSESDFADAQMTLVSDGIYSAEINDAYGNILFVRMPEGSTELNWGTKWNQTGDLQIPADKNQYNITGWGDNDGEWTVYGESGPVTPPVTPSTGAKDYFLKGYRGPTQGDITAPTADEQFESGVLEYAFEGDANGKGYFFVLVCEVGQTVGECYMASAYSEDTHCTLWPESQLKAQNLKPEVLGVPAPSVTFYLYDNGDGSLELSTQPIEGKTLVGNDAGPGQESLQQNTVSEKAYKTVINGQLRIVRGDKVFDVTGRQL